MPGRCKLVVLVLGLGLIAGITMFMLVVEARLPPALIVFESNRDTDRIINLTIMKSTL